MTFYLIGIRYGKSKMDIGMCKGGTFMKAAVIGIRVLGMCFTDNVLGIGQCYRQSATAFRTNKKLGMRNSAAIGRSDQMVF